MDPTDGFSWPKPLLEVAFEDFASSDLDAAMGGSLLPSLESLTPPNLIPAIWLSLDDSGAQQLLYVDRALSGTGGKYIRVVEHVNGEWRWIGTMLCKSLYVSEHRQEGWNKLTCVSQRSFTYERWLYVRCKDGYSDVRYERHDLEARSVQSENKECPQGEEI